MNLAYLAAGFVLGSLVTLFLGVTFLKYRMRSQLGMMEDQMEVLMDSAEKLQNDDFEMPENMKEVEDVEPKED